MTEQDNNPICERVQLNLSLQSDGELISSEEVQEIDEHLPGCEDCRAFREALEPLNEVLRTCDRIIRANPSEQDTQAARQVAMRAMETVRRGKKRRLVIKPYLRIAVRVAAIVLVALGAYDIYNHHTRNTKVIIDQLERSVIAEIYESKSIPTALGWAQWNRSQGDPERIRRAGRALYYVVQEAGGDVTAGPDRDLVVPVIWDIGKELFLLGFHNEDRKAEGDFYRLAEAVWDQAAKQYRPPPAVFMGLANCHKKRGLAKAQEYLKDMLEDPRLNAADRARGLNFLAFILTKLAEQKDLSNAKRTALLAEAEKDVREALVLTRGAYAKAYVNLYRTLSLQAEHEKNATKRTDLKAKAKKALDEGVDIAKKKLNIPGFMRSTRLYFTLSILYAYQKWEQEREEEWEKDALEAFRKARTYETRDFVMSIWAKTEPAFERLSPGIRKLLNEECAKSKYKQYAPATFSVVWDEEFELPPDPAGII